MTHYFWHDINGKHYSSRDCSPEPATLKEYKAMVRQAYGSLKGVKFGEVYFGSPHPND